MNELSRKISLQNVTVVPYSVDVPSGEFAVLTALGIV